MSKSNEANEDLAGGLRILLDNYGMSNSDIDKTVGGQLKETQIEAKYAGVVTYINNNKVAFAQEMDTMLTDLGATWNGVTYNLRVIDVNGDKLTPTVVLTATEELSAIKKYAPTPGFDAGKALTNVLRMIKAAENW